MKGKKKKFHELPNNQSELGKISSGITPFPKNFRASEKQTKLSGK